jgi:hypothetical protein
MLAALTLCSVVGTSTLTAKAQPDELSFSFAGDFGSGGGFIESLSKLSQTRSDFAFALGDLSDGGIPEDQWCSAFHQSFQNVLVLAGDLDTGPSSTTGGSINEFVRHCRYPLDVPVYGDYGKQYFFDYPFVHPIVRFVLLSPALRFDVDDGEFYDYSRSTPRYYWTRGVIDDARAAGIPWVIVGMHKNCIVAGVHGCEIGTDLFDLLLDRKVDLILQAHTSHYARSKQLGFTDTCGGIVAQRFNAGCIVNEGVDGQYDRGRGSVIVIAGTGGREISPFNASVAHAEYFAAWPEDPSALGMGFVTFHVNADRITAETNFNGPYRDLFTLMHRPPPSFVQSISGTFPFVAPAAVLFEVLAIAILVTRLSRRSTAPQRRSGKSMKGRAGVPLRKTAQETARPRRP